MPKIGKYCKAYPLHRLQEYAGWSEQARAASEDNEQGKGTNDESNHAPETSRKYLYLQENYTVTDGISMDEKIVFDAVTPEWTDFCRHNLGFEVDSIEPAG